MFGSFRRLQEAYGREEAIRSLAIEHYTAAEVLKVLQEHEKVDHVDFVPGGRVILLFTTQEYDEVHADYVAAKVAGIDMTGVEWLTREQVEQVSILLSASLVSPMCSNRCCSVSARHTPPF